MSLGTPAHARNLQTNINQSRYLFATAEAGEQELFLSTISGGGPNGNISTLAVGISGPAGNAVVVSEAPTFQASEFMAADQGAIFGSGSTYWSPSTISLTAVGVSITSDRLAGSGVGCIETFGGNGSLKGLEILSRGVDGALLSTTSLGINNFMSSIGRPGATAVLGTSGTLLTGGFQGSQFQSVDLASGGGGRTCFNINDLSGAGGLESLQRWSMGTSGVPTGGNAGSDFTLFSYSDAGGFLNAPMAVRRADGAATFTNMSSINGVPYPQNLLSTVMSGTQGVLAASNTVSLLYSHTSAQTSNMIAGQNYLVDVPANIITGAPGGSGAWLDIGVRLGGNGSFNYVQSMFIPPGGTPAQGIGQGVVQIADMGATNKNIDIVGYLQGVATLSISTAQAIGGVPCYMKMVT